MNNVSCGAAFLIGDEKIPHEICQKIIKLGEGKWNLAPTYGTTTHQKDYSLDNVRKCDVAWITENWVYDLICPYMNTANEQAGWKYDIVAAECCQLTRYTKDEFYTWHTDGMGTHFETRNVPDNKDLHGNTRKLSMSVFLNDNFEGGDFKLSEQGNIPKVPKLEEGSIIIFPSFMEHRVEPVTKGTKYSLVIWFLGPPFI